MLLITIGGLGTYILLICFVKVDSVQFLHSFRTIGTWIWQSFLLLYTIDSTGYICTYITFLSKTKIELWFGTLMLFFCWFLQKRPLGEIELRHRYTPAQPVLSCRTVDIDVSGTRTYRPKSSTDIIQEQHRLIHTIYTKRFGWSLK